jgi:two-component system nitrate/nitrite response regulator NarL
VRQSNQSICTIIVSQRTLLREGIASLLRDSPYKVVAGVAQASELKDLRIPAGRRTLVIFQTSGANTNFEEAAKNIALLRSFFPDSKVIVLAESSSHGDFQPVVALAPDGYILNLGSREILLKAIELTLLDQVVFLSAQPSAPSIAADYMETNDHPTYLKSLQRSDEGRGHIVTSVPNGRRLSQREQQILAYLAEGESNKMIARRCKITESTVKVHLKAILRKIDAHNRTQAAIWALANGYQRAVADQPLIESESMVVAPPLPPRAKS